MVSKLKPTFITDEYIKAVADSVATGNEIKLTNSVASSTTYNDDQIKGINYSTAQTASKNITTALNAAIVKNGTNTIIIEVDFTNENLNADFQIASIFINATYKGSNILVGVIRFETPELFPKFDAAAGSIYELKSRSYISVDNIANAKISVNSAGMATASSVQDLRNYVDGDFNADIARKSKDNTYSGVNTYNRKIIAPAGLQGNADTSSKLQGSVKVGGVDFDGSKAIDLPGVNKAGTQNTSGNASTASKLSKEFGLSFTGAFSGNGKIDGSKDVSITVDTAIISYNNNADLNTFKKAGNYYVYGNMANSPFTSTSYALLQVYEMPGGLVHKLIDLKSQRIYVRTTLSGSSFGSWDLVAKDSDVVKNDSGTQTIKGSVDIPIDNSMVRVGNDGDIAMMKKNGQGASLVVGSGKIFRLQRSNNAKVSPTDTLTDIFTVDPDGNVKAASFSGIIQPRNSNITDLNSIVDSGVYKIPNSFKNIPNGMPNGGIMEVYTYDGNVTYQILYVQGSKIWKRYKFGSTWYDWNLLADDNSVAHNTGNETYDGEKNFLQPIAGTTKIRMIPDNITSIVDLVKSLRIEFGSGSVFNIKYMVMNKELTDTPFTGGYLLIDISSRDGRTYLTINDANNNIAYAWYTSDKGLSTFSLNAYTNTANRFTQKNKFDKSIDADIDGNAMSANSLAQVELSDLDLNNYKTSGKYRFWAKTLKNYRSTGVIYGILFVTNYANIQQVLVDNGDNTINVRWFTAGKWTDWQKVNNDNNVLHLSGDETATGRKLFRDSIAVGDTTSASQLGNNGNLELNGALPFIDFHYGKSSKDYTSRIIENSEGQLSFVNASGIQSIKANLNGNADTATAPKVVGISPNTDLNNMKTAGFYSFQQGSIVNSPVATYFSLNVITVGNYNGTQVLVDANTGVVWTRSWSSGSKWSTWKTDVVQSLAATDANNVTDTGSYFFSGKNLPNEINVFYVTVMAGSNGTVKQVAYRDFDNEISIRSYTNNQWYDWTVVSSTSSTRLSSPIGPNGGNFDNAVMPTSVLNGIVSFSGYLRLTKDWKKGDIIGYLSEKIRPYSDLFISVNVNTGGNGYGIAVFRLRTNGEVFLDTINYNGQTDKIPNGAYIYFSAVNYSII